MILLLLFLSHHANPDMRGLSPIYSTVLALAACGEGPDRHHPQRYIFSGLGLIFKDSAMKFGLRFLDELKNLLLSQSE